MSLLQNRYWICSTHFLGLWKS